MVHVEHEGRRQSVTVALLRCRRDNRYKLTCQASILGNSPVDLFIPSFFRTTSSRRVDNTFMTLLIIHLSSRNFICTLSKAPVQDCRRCRNAIQNILRNPRQASKRVGDERSPMILFNLLPCDGSRRIRRRRKLRSCHDPSLQLVPCAFRRSAFYFLSFTS